MDGWRRQSRAGFVPPTDGDYDDEDDDNYCAVEVRERYSFLGKRTIGAFDVRPSAGKTSISLTKHQRVV